DAEVLLAGYAEWGTEVVDRLVGMYAFAVWDAAKRTLFLVRDRAGEKPLYYALDGRSQRFAFASEMTAILRCSWLENDLDSVGIAQYLQYGYVPSPLTAYRSVRKLPPGHFLLLDESGPVVGRYWDPARFVTAPRLRISEADAVEELDRMLTRAVKEQMVSDVPLGAFLSGGIDSSAIVALMAREGGTVRTFT